MQDKDLVLIADLFPWIEELRLRTDACICNDGVARITDDGIDALATKLKELKEIEFTGYAWFITDQSLFSLSTNCVKLRKISLCIYSSCQHYVTEQGIDFVACELTLEELTLINWALCGPLGISDLAQYLSNLTSIDLDRRFGLTSVTFYTLSKSCPLLEILMMARTREHLDISDNMWVNDTMLDNFGQVCPNLQFLGLSDCQRLTNLGIGEVWRGCLAIRQLNIDCLQVLDIFGRYSDNSVVNLKTLKAGGTQINDIRMAPMIGHRC
ncbi:hypothetical protein RHSIM_Rhsim01G0032400 [Rhododendron simsii]|uniref:Uncharacterized protein n=1 Tax=Rhododendron simsii TaxID=118357 RepID=A0A834HG26_RHOSS|nr:hypothetical protein RHSIM_Rhsim01G0032400 [Rhododendron simsii]